MCLQVANFMGHFVPKYFAIKKTDATYKVKDVEFNVYTSHSAILCKLVDSYAYWVTNVNPECL